MYGPFREAAEGALQFGDRKTYQMDPANVSSALREAELDNAEGTDLNNGKICRIKQRFHQIQLGACQVSGEFPMIKAALRLKDV